LSLPQVGHPKNRRYLKHKLWKMHSESLPALEQCWGGTGRKGAPQELEKGWEN